MHIKKGQWPVLIVNLLIVIIFSFIYWKQKDFEFLSYIGVIVIIFAIIILANKKVTIPNFDLWGLTLWALMHMTGGSLPVNGSRLYELILIPISQTYNIFRYDQLVHIIGFGVSTMIMYHLLKPHLQEKLTGWISISIVVVMAGLGVGAINEIIEFIATIIVPETGVGGYINTSLDLVADLIGALIALVIIRIREKSSLTKTLPTSTT
tara:strand:+ start:20329 stop:20952 length:624 start_codon:yes stop_codon:yes gene_type:complete